MREEKRPGYASALAGDIEAFLDFKAGLGHESHTRNYVLFDFDRWCAARGADTFDRATVEGWVVQRRERLNKDNMSWMSVIRDMGRFLQACGRPDAYVLSDSFKSVCRRPAPYLLSSEEVERFFDSAGFFSPRHPWHWQSGCFYGLMCSCGLRPGEARRLRRCDIRSDELEIDITDSKGGHSRRLPVTEEVMESILRCDETTSSKVGEDREFLFTSSTWGKVSIASAARSFKRIWNHAGLPASQHGRVATPYAFRHYFAYANIERWAREGADVDAMMPYLQRYMGHSTIEKTYYYVHVSPDFLSGYADITSGLDSLLPEVGFDA